MKKPCTQGARHTWAWLKNVTNSQIGGRGASFSLRGVYRCACGAKKVGAPNHNAPSPLNDLVEALANPQGGRP